MTQPPAGQPDQDRDDDAQVSQGPSGNLGVEGPGGADAVPDTPDTNFNPDASDTAPDRRGAALDQARASEDRRPDA